MKIINKHLYDWIYNKPKVDNKLSWLTKWGSLRYSANTTLLGLIVYDYFSNDSEFTVKKDFLNWAKM